MREARELDTLPPRSRGRLIAFGVAAIVGLALVGSLVLRPQPKAMVWIVNPGPEPAAISLVSETMTIPPGKTVDYEVPATDPIALTVARGSAAATTIALDVRDHADQVTLVDLGADAAYVVMDVSSYYADRGLADAPPILTVSSPATVHHLPYAAAKLVRPGRELPAKDSWELNALRDPDRVVTMYKVFRVEPSRTADRAALAGLLREGMASGGVAVYENMRAAPEAASRERTTLFDGMVD